MRCSTPWRCLAVCTPTAARDSFTSGWVVPPVTGVVVVVGVVIVIVDDCVVVTVCYCYICTIQTGKL